MYVQFMKFVPFWILHLPFSYPDTVSIWDLSSGVMEKELQVLEPDLCDVYVNCVDAPCDRLSCPWIEDAVCVDDYCGGCIARWYVLLHSIQLVE